MNIENIVVDIDGVKYHPKNKPNEEPINPNKNPSKMTIFTGYDLLPPTTRIIPNSLILSSIEVDNIPLINIPVINIERIIIIQNMIVMVINVNSAPSSSESFGKAIVYLLMSNRS